jgi:hypothetical protein
LIRRAFIRQVGLSDFLGDPDPPDETSHFGDRANAGLAEAGFIFHLFLRWFAEFLDARIAALLAMPLDENPA